MSNYDLQQYDTQYKQRRREAKRGANEQNELIGCAAKNNMWWEERMESWKKGAEERMESWKKGAVKEAVEATINRSDRAESSSSIASEEGV
jgi:anthranilate phosphoribosyltransferase